ncbi:protein adenylyltransferase SelO [Methylobacterium sp. J-068]|uniref:protein adenylyltransferase SelO n=1 Tax=Methylobacterium sp. J-068 TaxID=2836649 RepID=UPI001FBB6D85|nr:YdiU family protein [Methylobacterium sp. J-068]MCJ2036218.1 YdiU family protein [Methylobacterium sp. J-068]
MTAAIPFANTYARLPERFFAEVPPTPVAAPRLIRVNRDLADLLGIDPDWLAGPEGVAVLSGNRVPEGAEPLAMAYAGHQFGNRVPQLGDGRAILLGEVVGRDGVRRDIQLKGAGPTPFSRRGDGRAALGPVLREYVVSEAMAALGIPTTRALAAVLTGDSVMRETVLPGAVLTRVATSHIRVGTFQFFAMRGDLDGVRALADHVIGRHDPDLAEAPDPYRALLARVVARQADLVARWLLVGFIHGVMNTDNCAVSGETIDFGPCAFLDAYDPAAVFSAIDEYGRYAYGNQPGILHWNLTRLAEAMLPLLAPETEDGIAVAQDVLAAFGPRFEASYYAGLRAKLGLTTVQDGDGDLARALLETMGANRADFTLTFRRLGDAALSAEGDAAVAALFDDPAAYGAWATRWRARLAAEPVDSAIRRAAMNRVNPAFIPRNHRIEAVIEAAIARDDFAPFHDLVTVLANPYDDQPAFAAYAEPPQAHERVLRTFCGT